MIRAVTLLAKGSLALSLALSLSGCCKKPSPSGSTPTTASAGACPAVFNGIANGANLAEYSCECPASGAKGPVWGSTIYTRDSSLCTSAIHAGEIPSSGGGTITLKPAPGCPSYKGSLSHGVTSSGWGSFAGSYYFPAHGDGKCHLACSRERSARRGLSAGRRGFPPGGRPRSRRPDRGPRLRDQ